MDWTALAVALVTAHELPAALEKRRRASPLAATRSRHRWRHVRLCDAPEGGYKLAKNPRSVEDGSGALALLLVLSGTSARALS